MADLLKTQIHLPISKSKGLALGLLATVLLTVYLAVIAPVLGLTHEYADTVSDLQFRLERYRKVAVEKDRMLDQLEQIKLEGQQDQHYLNRATAALASADLQTQIKETVSKAGGELTSTQVIPERKEDRFTRVAVKVRMNGRTEVIREVLHDFESSTPFLFVQNLNVRPIRMPRNPAAKQFQPLLKLSVDFDVVGYMRTE
ncbi:MAG: type II secretion system protein GspM [Methylococcaceae bacterium]